MGGIDQAVAAVRAGQTVIIPTDTVYGLCATPYSEEPVAGLYRLKGRPETLPTALVCSDLDVLLECVPELAGRSEAIARALLPGAYTLIVANPSRRFRWLNGLALDTIGVRVPAVKGPGAEVLQQVGALAATSANRHRGIDPRRLEDVPREIREGCAAEVDGGELPGKPSTVVDLTGAEPKVVREGAVPESEALARIADASV